MPSPAYLAGRRAARLKLGSTGGLGDPPSSGWFMSPTVTSDAQTRTTNINNAFQTNADLNATSSMSDPAAHNEAAPVSTSGNRVFTGAGGTDS